jgi:CubicO group peptidase (beta-lactamase class C family)
MKRVQIYMLFVFCMSMTLASVSVAQEESRFNLAGDPRVTDAIDAWSAWIEYQLAINNVPGASVGVIYDQELLFAKGYGLSNPIKGRPAAPNTIYSICSNSKLFTSIAVMQLRDAGRLRLDDAVAKHLDWFAIKDVYPNDEPISIRRILTHSSGLPRE